MREPSMNFSASTSGLTALIAAGVAFSSCDCASTPVITDPELAGITTVEIHGRNFGTSGSVVFGDSTEVASTSSGTTWTDTRIVVAARSSGDLRVRTDNGVSNAVSLRHFVLHTRAIAPTADTDAHALAIVTLAGVGLAAPAFPGVWFVNQEFHRDLQAGSVNSDVVTALSAPRPPDPGPFAVYFEHFCLNGNCSDDVDIRTQTSVLGEDVVVDPAFRVWFSEGGALLYEERASHLDPSKQVMTLPNHSRIVMLDDALHLDNAAPKFRVYNLPGDRNELIGLAWDASTSKLWFVEGGRVGGNKLGRLDPEVAHFDTASPSFDFASDADATGYEFFPLPDALKGKFPAMPLVDPDGHVWFTMYLGNAIGRLDPSTKTFDVFPLPKPRAHKGPGGLFVTGGPWRIAFVDGTDSVVFGEQYDFEITKLDAKRVRAGDAACKALDLGGANPCMKTLSLPEDPNALADDGSSLLHSILVDAVGRIWFTEMGGTGRPNDDRIGFVTKDFAHVIELSPGLALGGPNGISVNGGVIDFAEFNGHGVGELELQ